MIRILQGDCREMLSTLPDASVQCCVTSPPYFGLRDYGTAQWEGGDVECDHAPEQRGGRFATAVSAKQASNIGSGTISQKDCRCGARRIDAQIGLEQSPDDYVAQLVAVFREVRRVLRDDGTLWLNLGDSYASNWPCNRRNVIGTGSLGNGKRENRPPRLGFSLKDKDLMMIPARVALALQADGWWLRSDIIWAKPNPMPESVTDRPTSAHEHVFLLTKSARYYYDADAVKEPMLDVSLKRLSQPHVFEQQGGPKDSKEGNRSHRKAINNQAERLVKHEKWKTRFEGWEQYDKSLGRNIRNVWMISTVPFPEAHFATFPPELAERCIKAGSRLGDTILDPFAGAFTTALVADRLQRNAIGIELNPEYCEMARRRIERDAGMFADIAP